MGVTVAVLDGPRVLLTMREDIEMWTLPGGGVEHGETLVEAAVRETREETGLLVTVERLVGMYSRKQWEGGASFHHALFAARVSGGELLPDPHEVKEVMWCALDDLPGPDVMLPFMLDRLADVTASVVGGLREEHYVYPFAAELTRRMQYARRDASGLARREWWLRAWRGANPH